ncbi:GGDEF domain-containing protein, partial [Cellulomonas hominis]|nr:GGDEF domain-containing protein [Cellulomonas hominis]
PRVCALAAAVTEAMGGSGWVVARAEGPDGDGPVVVARGGTSSLHVSGMRQIELARAPWVVTLESTLPADDRTVRTTLQTLLSLAVLGAA